MTEKQQINIKKKIINTIQLGAFFFFCLRVAVNRLHLPLVSKPLDLSRTFQNKYANVTIHDL